MLKFLPRQLPYGEKELTVGQGYYLTAQDRARGDPELH